MKKVVCVMFGGESTEYEVSLKSAYSVLKNIDKSKYDIYIIGITKDAQWYLFEGNTEDIKNDTWYKGMDITPLSIDISIGSFVVFDKEIYSLKPDIVFPVMHGAFGEDGRLQGTLEMAGMRYVGCNSLSSTLCMNKYISKLMAEKCGIPVAKYVAINKRNNLSFNEISRKAKQIGYPVFVKPAVGGSSVGISKVSSRSKLQKAVQNAFNYSSIVLIEEAITGKEVEISVIEDNGTLKISTPGSLRYQSDYYDYNTKYNCDTVIYEVPAKITKESVAKIREYAKTLFINLGCRKLSRIDFFVKENGECIFNEINTMPGFTDISMYPGLLINDGYTYTSLIDTLLS